MSLADRLAQHATTTATPRHDRHSAEVRWVDGLPTGDLEMPQREMPADEKAWRDHLAVQFPWLPIGEHSKIVVERVKQYGKVDEPMVSVHWRVEARPQDVGRLMPDAAAIRQVIRAGRRKPRGPAQGVDRAVILAPADPQVGKVGSRGGIAELTARTEEVLARADDYLRQQKPQQVVVADLGDIIEGFESHGGVAQMTTNDLSLMAQVEWARAMMFAFVDLAARHADQVVLTSVPSNHCRWRKGKSNLGTPADDWGLHIARSIASECARHESYAHVRAALPLEHDEVLALDVAGTVVGFAHGHQASPGKIPEWWARQVHGGSPLVDAEVLLTGHYHSFRTEPTGRSAITGREKRWFQAPTLDSGSDWYRHTAGADSDPGLLALTVERGEGWVDAQFLRNVVTIPDFVEVKR